MYAKYSIHVPCTGICIVCTVGSFFFLKEKKEKRSGSLHKLNYLLSYCYFSTLYAGTYSLHVHVEPIPPVISWYYSFCFYLLFTHKIGSKYFHEAKLWKVHKICKHFRKTFYQYVLYFRVNFQHSWRFVPEPWWLDQIFTSRFLFVCYADSSLVMECHILDHLQRKVSSKCLLHLFLAMIRPTYSVYMYIHIRWHHQIAFTNQMRKVSYPTH